MQVYDWDGDGRSEVIADFRSKEMTFLDGTPWPQDFIDKTRYTKVWGIDGRDGKVLWRQNHVTSDGQNLAEPPPRPANRILFVGDSFTVGYGADATTTSCTCLRSWDNNDAAYGPVTAKALEAE